MLIWENNSMGLDSAGVPLKRTRRGALLAIASAAFMLSHFILSIKTCKPTCSILKHFFLLCNAEIYGSWENGTRRKLSRENSSRLVLPAS